MPRRRKAPPQFDEWLEYGRRLIETASDEDLPYIEAWADMVRIEARLERMTRSRPPQTVPRNLKPAEAAARLGISVRKLTRERFTTYREVCIPIEGQTRGYVVSEKALESWLMRQRAERSA